MQLSPEEAPEVDDPDLSRRGFNHAPLPCETDLCADVFMRTHTLEAKTRTACNHDDEFQMLHSDNTPKEFKMQSGHLTNCTGAASTERWIKRAKVTMSLHRTGCRPRPASPRHARTRAQLDARTNIYKMVNSPTTFRGGAQLVPTLSCLLRQNRMSFLSTYSHSEPQHPVCVFHRQAASR